MGAAVAVQAAHGARGEERAHGAVRLHAFEGELAEVALQAVVVGEASAIGDRLLIGPGRVAGEVAVALGLGRHSPRKAVVGVALVALALGDPAVLEMAGGEGLAGRVVHIGDHRAHDVAPAARLHLVDPFEGVVVRKGDRAEGNSDHGREREDLPERGTGDPRIPDAQLLLGREGSEAAPAHAEREHDPDDAEERAQHADDVDGFDAHALTLATATALTLYSGSLDTGSKVSATTRLMSSLTS